MLFQRWSAMTGIWKIFHGPFYAGIHSEVVASQSVIRQ